MSKKKPAKRKSKVKVEPKTVDYYMSLPYPILLTPVSEEDGGGWTAEVELISGVFGHGGTPNEAVNDMQTAMKVWIDIYLQNGNPIAEPEMI